MKIIFKVLTYVCWWLVEIRFPIYNAEYSTYKTEKKIVSGRRGKMQMFLSYCLLFEIRHHKASFFPS